MRKCIECGKLVDDDLSMFCEDCCEPENNEVTCTKCNCIIPEERTELIFGLVYCENCINESDKAQDARDNSSCTRGEW